MNLGVRWTIGGAVHERGFAALRLSIAGAWKLFGDGARYSVCVNGLAPERARELTGALPAEVEWRDARREPPPFLRGYLDAGMAEGVGWKFFPIRLYPDWHELALDNDCILWEMPEALRKWLSSQDPRCSLLAEDVRRCLGQFEALCGPGPRNSGIRGLAPGLNYERELKQMLLEHPVRLSSELDEQGLQVATLERLGQPLIVRVDEVAICSPFWPHQPEPGRCGVHLVGLNAWHLPWDFYDRPADDWMAEHWERIAPLVAERVGWRL